MKVKKINLDEIAAKMKPVLEFVLNEYALPINGDHGIGHWARVLENGVLISESSDADVDVVAAFAVIHDSQRFTEANDPDHGPRAALVASKNWELFGLSSSQAWMLFTACDGHTTGRYYPHSTIQTCWDADRLDLGRVGITPDPDRLCTDAAQDDELLEWANQRACNLYIPPFVKKIWGIDL